jgi:hypothetical protein
LYFGEMHFTEAFKRRWYDMVEVGQEQLKKPELAVAEVDGSAIDPYPPGRIIEG